MVSQLPQKFVLNKHFKLNNGVQNNEEEYKHMFFFLNNFKSIKSQTESLLEEIQDLPKLILFSTEKIRDGNILISLQILINKLYVSLIKDNYPFFFEYFRSRILAKPYLKKVLKYINEYLLIFDKYITDHFQNVQYYDVEEGLVIPSKKKFSDVYGTIESILQYMDTIRVSLRKSCMCIHPVYIKESAYNRLRTLQIYHPIHVCEELSNLEPQKSGSGSLLPFSGIRSRIVDFEEDEDEEDEEEFRVDQIIGTQKAYQNQKEFLWQQNNNERLQFQDPELVFGQRKLNKLNKLRRLDEQSESESKKKLIISEQLDNEKSQPKPKPVDSFLEQLWGLNRDILRQNHQSNRLSFIDKRQRQKKSDEDLNSVIGDPIRKLLICPERKNDKQLPILTLDNQLDQQSSTLQLLDEQLTNQNVDKSFKSSAFIDSKANTNINTNSRSTKTNIKNLERRFAQMEKETLKLIFPKDPKDQKDQKDQREKDQKDQKEQKNKKNS